ncbi:MAG TPA: histone deacetylase family protein [Anaerolineae bacterium]|nr:histone deacetylase family protein [Anaerolineae bacterium]HQH38430.1 histone deacetylase family protein [Anaerolineae bacterium]
MKIIYTDRHHHHATDGLVVEGQPFVYKETPARAEAILAAVQAARLGLVTPPADYGLAPLLAVHDADYIAYMRTAYAQNAAYCGATRPLLAGRNGVTLDRAPHCPADFISRRDYYTYDYEDPILEGTWEAAYWSAQCALTAADFVRRGEPVAYALCRPPGHHAMPDQYGGFCYLNNVAIAARSMQAAGPVAILDIDYHHGNGTQAIFYADPAVLFCSLHADPDVDYPFFWGRADEHGEGPGTGLNHNWPLPLQTDDALYLAALDEALNTIADFTPRYLLISLGLDAAVGDLIGKFHITTAGFREIGQQIAALKLPTVIVQEGGYRVETLGENATAFLRAFVAS